MSKEIKEKIDALCNEMEKNFDPTTFVLNHRMKEIGDEIQKLRGQCKHNFIDGCCEFCRQMEAK